MSFSESNFISTFAELCSSSDDDELFLLAFWLLSSRRRRTRRRKYRNSNSSVRNGNSTDNEVPAKRFKPNEREESDDSEDDDESADIESDDILTSSASESLSSIGSSSLSSMSSLDDEEDDIQNSDSIDDIEDLNNDEDEIQSVTSQISVTENQILVKDEPIDDVEVKPNIDLLNVKTEPIDIDCTDEVSAENVPAIIEAIAIKSEKTEEAMEETTIKEEPELHISTSPSSGLKVD